MNAITHIAGRNLAEVNAGLTPDESKMLSVAIRIEPGLRTGKAVPRHLVTYALEHLHVWEYEFTRDVFDTLIEKQIFVNARRTNYMLFRGPKKKPRKKPKAGFCAYCKMSVRELTKDHIIPKAKGGSDDRANIVWACQPCNTVKGDRTPQEWARDVLEYQRRTKPALKRFPFRYWIALTFGGLKSSIQLRLSATRKAGAK